MTWREYFQTRSDDDLKEMAQLQGRPFESENAKAELARRGVAWK